MSYFPPSALTKRQPASRHTGGKEMEFQLDVNPDYHEQSAESNKKHRSTQLEYHTRNPRVKNPQDLENIVPESEREGYNEDGISRKLAWLAKNGYTVHTYEEMLTARVPAPQVPRKERRRLLIERRKVIFENQRFEREQAAAAAKGPATTMVPRSESAYKPPKYRPPPTSPFTRTPIDRHQTQTPSPMTYSGSSRHSSMAPESPAPLPQGYVHPQFDASQWMDETFGSTSSAFAPEAGLPPDPRTMMAEVNELFTPEEQAVYGFIPSGYEQFVGGQPDPFWQEGLPLQGGQPQYGGGMVVPEFPNYPGGSSYHPSQYTR